MRYCPNCGRKISKNNKFCPYCGTSLKSITNESLTSENNNKSNFNIPTNNYNQHPHKEHHYIIKILIAVILLAVGAGSGYIFAHNNDKSAIQRSNKVAHSEHNNQHNTKPVVRSYQRIRCPNWLRGYWFTGYNHKGQYSILSFNKRNNPWNNKHLEPIFFRVNKNKVFGGFYSHGKANLITFDKRNNGKVIQGVHYAKCSSTAQKLLASSVKRSHHHAKLFKKINYHKFHHLVYSGENDK